MIEFVRVAQAGSFTAAAATLGLTGSAVGKSVSRLEARLGTKLFHRTTRRITLTNEGEVYYESCVRALEELDDVEQRLMTGRSEPVGRVRLDLPGAFGRRHVLPILQELVLRHPGLDLSINFSERTAVIVEEGVDLAVRIGRLADDADLVAVPLGRQRLVICASPSYLAGHGTPSMPADLASRDCITGWRRDGHPAWLLRQADGTITSVPVRARHELSDGEAMVAATLAGGGLCQLPTWLLAEHLASGGVRTVLDDHAGAEMPIHAVWPRSRYVRPAIRVIVAMLRQHAQMRPSPFYA
ncbi:LysR family transcriptional regulator [Methylobacterium sp. Leaf102]|uniref:LysR family transcriptional regulator n=1 Tax=Methylobacterium sp. Leaf102 TaxID=1736253 RepID=UPI0019102D5A|nr:LysR family transcriptional regulator [Methylobacterium sp. Leaf102]